MKTTVVKVARVLVWLVYLWVLVTEVLLLLAFILQLFGANPTAGFVEWVYRSTERAMAPFRGIFESISLSDQSVLDVSVLFAMVVYGFVALGLQAAADWLLAVGHREERRQRQAEQQAAAGGPDRIVQLAGPTGVSAQAVMSSQPWGTAIELTAAGLDPVQTYSVWLETRHGGRTSAGTFRPGPNGSTRASLTSHVGLRDVETFGLAIVPPAASSGTDILASRLA